MHQIVKCECGESMMQHGRCCGCLRVRPSSQKLAAEITRLQMEIGKIKAEIVKAKSLESVDRQMVASIAVRKRLDSQENTLQDSTREGEIL